MRKNAICEQIEREREYLNKQEAGSEEYVASQKRLSELYKLIDDSKGRRNQLIMDATKFVVGGVIIPVSGLLYITAKEEGITFTGALRDYTKLFLPKR